jgi:hypothetical protein
MAAIMSKNNIQDVSLIQITSELEEKKKELKIKNDEIDRLKEKEIGMLKQEIEILTQENIELKEENVSLTSKVKILQFQYEELEKKYNDLHNENKTIRADLEGLRNENNLLRSQSLAIDLKNNLIDLFIFKNNNEEQFKSVFGDLVTTRYFGPQNRYSKILVDGANFYKIIGFLQREKNSEELQKIEEIFQDFTQNRISLKNDLGFAQLKKLRNENKLTHGLEKTLADYDLNLTEFLEAIKSDVSDRKFRPGNQS